ncbi:rod shape-determining protein MreD [Romboutsia lituseburensis]|uniref:Rod shape-determining protein MreD n=1 Tax=Romboutsia lituseburensis DSM 797 TaxID=1121325 RepID=A0A1G9NTX0_9FIRM|nr:rod shape-determining protein MreD [Romboutsia lituseburensis]CEH33111.1 Rod shape-determining protein MreD [Romboutsia lituseburensis]SDL89824.1 rod shape-determining protein MreD [Romboutsia lituseburensis DSM 797]
MKKVLLCLFGILLVMVENSITNYLDILSISFNIVIIYMTIIALYLDELDVGIIGAIIGLVKDITVCGIFGVNGLVLFIIAYSISHLRDKIYKESSMTIFVLVLITSLFDSLVNIATVSQVFNTNTIAILALKGIIIIPIANSLLSILLYRISKKSILKLKED